MELGTVKVGRWEYPARLENKVVHRNTKRDGSGEWVIASIAAFKPNAEHSNDYDDLRAAYRYVLDASGAAVADIAKHVGVTASRTSALMLALKAAGLVDLTYDKKHGRRWVPTQTLEDVPRNSALAKFSHKVPVDTQVVVRRSNHGSYPGAQTKKPGKSTWEVGDLCPQGHLLESEEDIYTMPSSGRHKCMHCRAEYKSNQRRRSAA